MDYSQHPGVDNTIKPKRKDTDVTNRLKKRFATLIAFGLAFELVVQGATHFGFIPHFTAIEIICLFLGASLVGRAISYLTVFEWLRYPFTKLVPHSSGAGLDVHPRTDKGPVVEVIGEWVCCPICSGTWAALGLVTFYAFFPEAGRFTLYVVGAGGAAAIWSRLGELLEWDAHLARERTGRLNLENKDRGATTQAEDLVSTSWQSWMGSYRAGITDQEDR
jgi:hypothetical protein